jgi:hypothetical protein
MNWYESLNEDEIKYIKNHPDPSHMISYLKKGIKFTDALKLGYRDYVNEDIKLKYNESLSKENMEYNMKIK